MCQFCTHRRTQCSGYNFVYLYFLSFSHYAWLRLLHLYSLSLSYIQVQAEIMKHMCNRGPYYRYRRYYRATFMDNSQCACRRREIPLQDNSEQRDSTIQTRVYWRIQNPDLWEHVIVIGTWTTRDICVDILLGRAWTELALWKIIKTCAKLPMILSQSIYHFYEHRQWKLNVLRVGIICFKFNLKGNNDYKSWCMINEINCKNKEKIENTSIFDWRIS